MRSRLSRQHTLLPHASDMVQIWESTRARLETWLHSRKTQATALDHSLTPSAAEKDFHTLSFFVILEGWMHQDVDNLKTTVLPLFHEIAKLFPGGSFTLSWQGSLKGSHSYLARLLCRMQLMPRSLPTG